MNTGNKKSSLYENIKPEFSHNVACPFCNVKSAYIEIRYGHPHPSWWRDNKGNYHKNTYPSASEWMVCDFCGEEEPQ